MDEARALAEYNLFVKKEKERGLALIFNVPEMCKPTSTT
jgi:hypothetical protein